MDQFEYVTRWISIQHAEQTGTTPKEKATKTGRRHVHKAEGCIGVDSHCTGVAYCLPCLTPTSWLNAVARILFFFPTRLAQLAMTPTDEADIHSDSEYC
eukprot:3598039-Pyramimonas_sp.AAC.1